jgi:outer membrane receptor protein involved in Fe transport
LIVGVDTYQGEVDTKAFDRRDLDLRGPFSQFSTELDINAYFIQYQRELSEQLSLLMGARYEDISLSSTVADNQQASFSDVAPKIGLNYHVSDNHQLWFSVSEGFYAPALDDLFDAENGNPELDPEQAVNVEFGFRGTFGDLSYDASIYHNRIDNYLVTQEFEHSNGDEFELTTNAGQVTVKGIESVVEYAPQGASWRIGLTHTYADNRYDSFVQSTPGAADDLSGRELRRSPKHHLNARIAWEPITNVTAELEGDFYSRYFSDDANSQEGKFKRDERVNVRLTYHHDSWRFWVNALNVTDTLEDRATFRRDTLSFRTIDGRSYYAGLSYQF